MHWFLLGIAVGTITAMAVTYISNRIIGTIWVVQTNDEPPCLLLELDNEVDSVGNRKKVIFRVQKSQK